MRSVPTILAFILLSSSLSAQPFAQRLLGPNTGGALGVSIAMDGDTVAIGNPEASNGSGAIIPFDWHSGSGWFAPPFGQFPKPSMVQGFGASAALHGSTLVVGALEDQQNPTQSGGVFVFEKVALGTWVFEQALSIPNQQLQSFDIGESVAFDGDRLVIGDRTIGDGRAHVFERNVPNGAWIFAQTLLDPGLSPSNFGWEVAVHGDTVAVGCIDGGNPPLESSGMVAVYRPDAFGVWTLQQQLFPSDPALDKVFGSAVDIEGDTIVVGAPGLNSVSGAVYVFEDTGGSVAPWVQQQRLEAATTGPTDRFGSDVDLDGTCRLVGASHFDSVAIDSGAAFLFELDLSSHLWSQIQSLEPGGGIMGMQGVAVAIQGNDAFLGGEGRISRFARSDPFVRGDVDANGIVGFTDVFALLGYLFQGNAIGCGDAADTNDDALISLADVIYFFSALFSGGPPLPAPNVECGDDPVLDAVPCRSYTACP